MKVNGFVRISVGFMKRQTRNETELFMEKVTHYRQTWPSIHQPLPRQNGLPRTRPLSSG
jgi:hypothetical protein